MQVIRLNEDKFYEFIEEAVKHVINESLSQRAYHFTSLFALLNIADSNTFKCSPSYNDGTKQMYDVIEYPYFFSTTRVKDGRFGYSNSFGVRIELNADMFNSRYKAKPYNFFGKKEGESEKQGNIKMYNDDEVDDDVRKYQLSIENEDRVFVRTPYIQNASKYIKRVDVLISRSNVNDLEIYDLDNYSNILYSPIGGKIVFYDNEDEYNRQGKNDVTDEVRERVEQYRYG